MHQYALTVTTFDGLIVEGKAKDIRYIESEQCLVLERFTLDSCECISVAIKDIATLSAITANPYFSNLQAE
jgi:transcriptional antiterminator Rof (Rho-off)